MPDMDRLRAKAQKIRRQMAKADTELQWNQLRIRLTNVEHKMHKAGEQDDRHDDDR